MLEESLQLYQELILDHNAHPRNFGPLKQATSQAVGDNPLCGDRIEVQMCVQNNRVVQVHFCGDGCAIAKASASMMTEAVQGKTTQHVTQLFDAFQALVKQGESPQDVALGNLGKLTVFAGVGRFPMRVKCATLAWHALRAALGASSTRLVSTEL